MELSCQGVSVKIVAHSNFNNENVSEVLVAENIQFEFYAKVMLDALLATVTESSPYYFKLEKDDYQLYTWDPNK